MSANGQRGGPPRDRVLERTLDVGERLGEHDRATVHFRVEAGLRGELGKPIDGHVDFHGPAARLPTLDRRYEVVGKHRAIDLVEERDLRVRRRDHNVGAELLAGLQRDAEHAAVHHVDATDGRVRPYGRAVLDRGGA